MALTKKQKETLKELIKIGQTESIIAPAALAKAIELCQEVDKVNDKASKKISILREANSDLNAAVQKRNLEIELFNKRQCSAEKERSYDEWAKGIEDTLNRLAIEREKIRSEGNRINRRRLIEIIGLGFMVIVNCVCLLMILFKLY